MRENELSQALFEDRFIKELNNELVEAEVITMRDVASIKKKAQEI